MGLDRAPRDAHEGLVVGPLVSEELPALRVTDRLEGGPVRLAPGQPTSLVVLLDRVGCLGIEGQVL